MTAAASSVPSGRAPTREECIADAVRIYDGILADPVRAAQIRAARRAAERAIENSARPAGGQAARRTTAERKSA